MASEEVVVVDQHQQIDNAKEDKPVEVEKAVAGASTPTKAPLEEVTLASPMSPGKSPEHKDNAFSRFTRALSSSISHLVSPRPSPRPPVEEDDIPEAFIVHAHGNRNKAKKRWEETKKWRLEHKIDAALTRPHFKYPYIKQFYPQVLQGWGLNGELVSIEMPSKLDCPGLRKAGVTPADMGVHIGIAFEYMFKMVAPAPNATCMTIMDLAGLSLSKAVSFDNLAILKAVSDTVEEHYPGRLKKILVINPPRLFSTILGIIKGVLPASVRDSLEILHDVKDLQKYVSLEHLPKQYGGTGPDFAESPLEKEGYQYFMDVIQKANENQTPTSA